MPVKDKLRHKIDVAPVVSQDKYGEVSYGASVIEVPCYIDGRYRRIAKGDGTVISIDYSILFLPDADLGINYRVTNGVDKDGNLLLLSGKVVGLEDSNHPIKGRIIREAFIEAN